MNVRAFFPDEPQQGLLVFMQDTVAANALHQPGGSPRRTDARATLLQLLNDF